MNNELKDKIYDVPLDILTHIQNTLTNLNGIYYYGIERAKKLLSDKKVTYGQLKRIIHDLSKIDKNRDIVKYNLYGGDKMLLWSKNFLNNERQIIDNRKRTRKNADDVGGLDGIRKNNYNKTHTKSLNVDVTKNLFEEIDIIKKLIKY